MKLGLFLMPLHYPDRAHADTYQEDLELVEFADSLGYTETWVGEHFLLPWENMPSPELFIARALGVTKHMSFGTGVSLAHFHHPAHLAHRISQLDHMARGRLFLGIGAGGSEVDSALFDIDVNKDAHRERMAECVDVVLKIWEGKPFEHRGKFFNATLEPDQPENRIGFHMKPYQKPHPPIAVAGSSPYSSTLEEVGEKGWIPLSSSFLHEMHLPSHRQVFERGAKRGGQPIPTDEWRISREVYVADDGDKAREDALNGPIGNFFDDYWIPLFGRSGPGIDRLKIDPKMPTDDLTREYMLENYWIVGDPEECAHRIKRIYDDVGGFGTLLLQCHDWVEERPKWFRCLELMANETLPLINKAIGNKAVGADNGASGGA